MPPKGGSLEAPQIAILEAWIAQGPVGRRRPGRVLDWAYRAPVRLNPPAVSDPYWPRNPIDQFILAKPSPWASSPPPKLTKRLFSGA